MIINIFRKLLMGNFYHIIGIDYCAGIAMHNACNCNILHLKKIRSFTGSSNFLALNGLRAGKLPSMALDSGSPCRRDGRLAGMRIADQSVKDLW